jgi:hypothetical protein
VEQALAESIAELQRGDHVCWRVDDERARVTAAAACAAAGLRTGDRVVWCPTDPRPAMAALAEHGVAAIAAIRTGRLSIVRAADWYRPDDRFDPDGTVEVWNAACEQAHLDGYPGLLAITDMSWALLSGAANVASYEVHLNRVFVGGAGTGVCLYDGARFGRHRLATIGMAHPATWHGIPPTPSGAPLLRIRRDGPVLRLSGDSDLSNRLAVHGCLSDLRAECAQAGAAMQVDASDLRFADHGTAVLLVRLAQSAAAGITVQCSPRLRDMLDLHDGATTPGLRYAGGHSQPPGSNRTGPHGPPPRRRAAQPPR